MVITAKEIKIKFCEQKLQTLAFKLKKSKNVKSILKLSSEVSDTIKKLEKNSYFKSSTDLDGAMSYFNKYLDTTSAVYGIDHKPLLPREVAPLLQDSTLSGIEEVSNVFNCIKNDFCGLAKADFQWGDPGSFVTNQIKVAKGKTPKNPIKEGEMSFSVLISDERNLKALKSGTLKRPMRINCYQMVSLCTYLSGEVSYLHLYKALAKNDSA